MGLGFVIGQRVTLRQFSSEIGGKFIKGGFLPGHDKVVARVMQWPVTIDTYDDSLYSNVRSRIRAAYVSKDDFLFTIYPEHLFAKLGKALGMQDVTLGDRMFDDAFVVKASDKSKVRALLEEQKIRLLIQDHPSIHLESENIVGSPIRVLLAEVDVIVAVERMKSLLSLVNEILNHLYRTGSASKDDPHFVL